MKFEANWGWVKLDNDETAFVDLGKKSVYSLKSAFGDMKSIMPTLKKRNQTHYAVTDYGEVGIWVSQYFECVKNDIVPILGMQTFVNNYRFEEKEDGVTYIKKLAIDEQWEKPEDEVSDNEKDWAQIDFPLNIFATDLEGYYNIIKIHNSGQITGVKDRPRTNDTFIRTHTNSVVATLPTPYSEVSSLVYNGRETRAKAVYDQYKALFDDVYVEVPILEDEDYREINRQIVRFCKKHQIKMIPVINSHYDHPDDEQSFPVFQKCGRLRGGFSYEVDYAPGMYYKSAEEVFATYKKFHESEDFDELTMRMMFLSLQSLLKRFAKFELDTSPKLPRFDDSENKLRQRAFDGLKKLGLDNHREYIERLEYELDNIIRAGFADYFIMLEDLYTWHTQRQGRLGSTGRGSAAGSLVLYCIGVTKVDPVKYGLLFERFLDASRLDEIINKGGRISGSDFPDVDCFTLDTLVLTDKGTRPIGDLKTGDLVVTRDGGLEKVEKIADIKNSPVVRVCYGDWYFDCTLNHRLLVKRDDDIDYMFVHDLQCGDLLVENEDTFAPVTKIFDYGQTKPVVDLKIANKSCFRVCGKSIKDNSIHTAGVVVHNCDFQSSVKDDVKNYFAEKYGEECVCSIGTIGFLRTKSALKELGRVHDLPPEEINLLTTRGLEGFKPDDEEDTLDELKRRFPALNDFLTRHPIFERDFARLHGTINCWGVHAGGILVHDKPLVDQLPVRVNDGKLCTVWTEGLNSRELGRMGFIKLDILAIQTLDVIEEAIELINSRHNTDLTFDDIPLDDIASLEKLQQGFNLGVFQFETQLALRVAKNMGGIKKFEDLGSLSTLIRPAALENKFDVKFGEFQYGVEHPDEDGVMIPQIPDFMKEYIGKEYGLPIYQEAAYFFAKYMAGFSNVEAYQFMRKLYKNQFSEELIPIWREKFIRGCMEQNKLRI